VRRFRWELAAVLSVAASCAVAQPAASSADAHRHTEGPELMARHQQFVQEGEAKLAAGDASGAQQAFEAATQIVHAADVELGLVRSYMQAGDYRRALSFSAHAAGAHRELPSGMALYAWLLYVGGQQAVAMRMLDDWIARAPDDIALRQAKTQLATPTPRAEGVLALPPWRMAPNDGSGQVPANASVTGSAVLGGDGRSALAAAAATDGAHRVWVRNGMGRSTAAHVAQRFDDLGLVLLELENALVTPAQLSTSPAAPFAGSPSYMVEFVTSDVAGPAWPLLRQGFFGRSSGPSLPPPLGIDAPRGARGGPVFDRSGRLAGVAVSSADGVDRLMPMASIHQQVPAFGIGDRPDSTAAPMTIDAMYETALRLALQVAVER
jgi:hypothetical protein